MNEIRKALERGMWAWDQLMPKAPEHVCGPEAGCDGVCAEWAAWVDGRTDLIKALAILPPEESKRAKPGDVCEYCEAVTDDEWQTAHDPGCPVLIESRLPPEGETREVEPERRDCDNCGYGMGEGCEEPEFKRTAAMNCSLTCPRSKWIPRPAPSSEKALEALRLLQLWYTWHAEATEVCMADDDYLNIVTPTAAFLASSPAPVVPRPEDVKQPGPRAATAPNAGPCNTSPPAPEAPK